MSKKGMTVVIQSNICKDTTVVEDWYVLTDKSEQELINWILEGVKNKSVEVPNAFHVHFGTRGVETEGVSISTIVHEFESEEAANSWLADSLQVYLNSDKPRFNINLDEVCRRIRKLRAMLLVNACIYYDYNDNLISDYLYDKLSYELADLQKRYSELIYKIGFFDSSFSSFEGFTGYNLPFRDPWVRAKAYQLINYRNNESK